MSLSHRIAARSARAFDDTHGNEQAVEGRLLENLVGVEIILLTDAKFRPGFGLEIEGWVDHVVAVGEKKLHGPALRLCT
jgi:hypothetical protein